MTGCVRIFVVTYHRPHLLERALRSLIAQTHADWIAEVLNDDPDDARVPALLAKLSDPRIQLSQPPQRRGGTGNFNHAFRPIAEPFGSILEDDNWWEPAFLEAMLSALGCNANVALACGNERIWQEQPDGKWVDSGKTIWASGATEELYAWSAVDQCGGARVCNSSLLFRTSKAGHWQTPATIPIDVTEHFRERVIPHPILLVHRPLVNYAETRVTFRSPDTAMWARYQLLLTGSVFALARPDCREGLARALWQRAREIDPRLATTLLATGLFVPAARALWRAGRPMEKIRFAAGAVRHLQATISLARACSRHAEEWAWLQQGAFAEFMQHDRTFAGPKTNDLQSTNDGQRR
jgi:hypothetical protein